MVTAATEAEGGAMVSDIHKLIKAVWNMKELPQHWKQSVSQSVYPNIGRVIIQIVVIIEA
jgi:hypothetical protein